MNHTREKAITKTSIIGIVVNILLSAFKAAVGLVSGSIAIVLDAVNNLTDALSSVITIVGIRLAKKKPDSRHPYGYGRIEYFSAILISVMILFAGVTSIRESVKKIITLEKANYTAVTILIVAVSVIAKLLLGRYVKKQGQRYNSDALSASGADASFDAVISASTLLAAAATLLFDLSIDGIVGAVISVFIIKAGIELLLESVSDVMGNRADSELTKSIKKTIGEIEPVLGVYDLILHNYGPEAAIGSVHVEIPAAMNAHEIQLLEKKIQNAVASQYHIVLTVGIYAIEQSDQQILAMEKEVSDLCRSMDGVINMHGFFVDQEEKYMSFDVTVDFTVKDKALLIQNVKTAVLEKYSGYRIDVQIDTNYSD